MLHTCVNGIVYGHRHYNLNGDIDLIQTTTCILIVIPTIHCCVCVSQETVLIVSLSIN